MNTAIRESPLEQESDADLIEYMGMKADFPEEAMAAYGLIYQRFWNEMYVIAKGVTKNEDSAQDLLADTFNKIYWQAHSFQRKKLTNPENMHISILSWMTTIMKHVFFDHYLDDTNKTQDSPLEESYIIDKKLVANNLDDYYHEFIDKMETYEMEGKCEYINEGAAEEDGANLTKLKHILTAMSDRDKDIVLTYYAYHVPGKHTPGTVLDELERRWETTRDTIRKVLEKFRKKVKAELENQLVIRK